MARCSWFRDAARVTVLAASLAGPAFGQAQGDSTTVIRGVVYDSLIRSGPLADAEVWVDGTNRSVRTDASGRFMITGLPAARHTLTFYHALLDSTGMSARPVTVETNRQTSATVVLATPSPATVHRAFCPRDEFLIDVGVVLGVVREAPSSRPIPEIAVQAEWTAYLVGGAQARSELRTARARSDAGGRVILCGIPTDVAVVIRGQAGAGPEGMVVVDLKGRRFSAAALHLSMVAGAGSVSGSVRTLSGAAVVGAIVVAVGTQAQARSDPRGNFVLRDVLAGSRIIEVRAIGFRPGRSTAAVAAGGTARLDLVIGDSVQVLDPIVVEGEYQPYLAQVGFTRRRNTAMGHYLDQFDIERTGAVQFEEVFRMVPGVRLRPSASGYLVEIQRAQGQALNPALANYCPPSYFIDGVFYPLPPLDSPTLPLVPQEVLAIEVYSNIFSAPQQFQRRDGGCGIVLIWTKRGVPNR